MIALKCGIEKFNKLVNITNKKQIHRYREQVSGYQREGRRKGQYWGRGLADANYYIQDG